MNPELHSLKQKVSLITGASSGIGKATAILFASLGCRLALVARDEQRLQETVNACQAACKTQHCTDKEPFIYIIADLVNTKQLTEAYNRALAHFSQLDILVNNAGYLPRDSIETIELDQFERTMKINLYSAIMLTQLAVPALAASKGVVINVSSVAGMRAFPGVLSYCVSKAAMDQFTQCSAIELAPKGIRVNSVNPGVIITSLHRTGGMSEEEYSKFLVRSKETHPLGRYGQPEEVAEAIAFLASSASSFTTGHLLSVDGGRGLLCPR